MTASQHLNSLIGALNPRVRPGSFVFVSRPEVEDVPALAHIQEDEGVTLVLHQEVADERGWAYDGPYAWISLGAVSALTLVGLTAVLSTALAEAGIACNVLAGFHHDHLLVPHDRCAEALAILEGLGSGHHG